MRTGEGDDALEKYVAYHRLPAVRDDSRWQPGGRYVGHGGRPLRRLGETGSLLERMTRVR